MKLDTLKMLIIFVLRISLLKFLRWVCEFHLGPLKHTGIVHNYCSFSRQYSHLLFYWQQNRCIILKCCSMLHPKNSVEKLLHQIKLLQLFSCEGPDRLCYVKKAKDWLGWSSERGGYNDNDWRNTFYYFHCYNFWRIQF